MTDECIYARAQITVERAMSLCSNGDLDLSPLFRVESAIVSRRIEPDLIAQNFTRSLTVNSEDETEGGVATISIDDIELSNATIAVILKATGYRTYSLIRDGSNEDKFFEDIILIRK